MKSQFKRLPCILFFFSQICLGQSPKALLYEISGNNLKSTSYLFGTIHMICEQDFYISDSVIKAIKKSKQVVFEVDLNQPNMMMKAFSMMRMKGDTTLKSLYSDSDYVEIKQYLSDSVHLPGMMFNKTKPVLLEALVLPNMLQCDVKEFEMEINAIAKQEKKEISGLESLDFQLGILDQIPYKLQAESLLKIVRNKKKTKDEFSNLIFLYKNKDLDGMLNLENSDSTDFSFKFQDHLLDERNLNWIPIMSEKMGKSSTFFGVGAAHLAGNKGLLQLLKEAGYKVRPIFD